MTDQSPQDTLLSLEGVALGYGEQPVLQNVSFTVDPGEIVVLVGGSGSGKSTILRAIVGLLSPRTGRILVCGRDIHAAEADERDAILRNIGMSFQSAALLGSLTVAENVALPILEHTDLDEDTALMLAQMRLSEVGLVGVAWQRPTELSGGMRKRAGIARALALEPPLLLLDEPSAGLDPVTARDMDDLILAVRDRSRIGIVAVTHEVGSIETIADRAIMLADGRVIAAGPLDEVRANPDDRVQRFFRRQGRPRDATQTLAEALEWRS